ISAHQAARTQLDAAEPAHDQDGNAIALLAIYSLKYGTTGRTARLAIIIETILRTYSIGPAIVRGIGNTVRSKKRQGLGGAIHLVGQGDEAALLDVFLVRGQAAQGAWHGGATSRIRLLCRATIDIRRKCRDNRQRSEEHTSEL